MSGSTWTWRDALSGVVPPMISPLTPAHQVDDAAVRRVVDYVLAGGCTGLFVLGGVGEGAWLDSEQRARIVRTTVEAAAGRAPVLVGCMLPGTAPAREAALRAVDAGADALVIGSPYYFAPDAASQLRHVEAILAATSLPLLLYNIPSCTHTPLATEAIEALATERRILGIKDSWGELAYFQSLLTLKLKRADFYVLQGHEHAAMPSLLLGANGLVPGLANIAPRLMVDLVRAAHAGDLRTAQALHEKVLQLTLVYSQGLGLTGIYAAAERMGLASSVPAEPWVAVSQPELLRRIDTLIAEFELRPLASV